MRAIGRTTGEHRLFVRRAGEATWILRPRAALDNALLARVRDAFLEAVDSGAQRVVVDLADADAIALEAVATLAVMADQMLGRNGALWLAGPPDDQGRQRLRAIGEHGQEALRGVAPALDAALDASPREPVPPRRPAGSSSEILTEP